MSSKYNNTGLGVGRPSSGGGSKLLTPGRSRTRREASGVFSLFQPPQIAQFKEAFQLIDHDKDGWVGESDLKEIFASLGGCRVFCSHKRLEDSEFLAQLFIMY